MPTKRLPAQPDLEHLKNQAHDLLKGFRTRDARARRALPSTSDQDVQFTLAMRT